MKIYPIFIITLLLFHGAKVNGQFSFKFKETKFDFGKIYDGSPAEKEFRVTNLGKEPIYIFHVNSTGGGAYPSFWTKGPIRPGKYGYVRVKYDTNNRIGPFHRTSTATIGNGNTTEYIPLIIIGEVIRKPKTDSIKKSIPEK